MTSLLKRLTHIKYHLRVQDIMSKDVITLDKDKKVMDAVKIMSEKHISTIVILDDKKLVGIVTERDLVTRVLLKSKHADELKLANIMSTNPKRISPESPILVAANHMKSQNVRKLLVVDANDNILGLISQTDIINSLNKINEEYSFILSNPLVSFIFLFCIILLVIMSLFLTK